jgi:hypothetical protein
MPKMKIKSKFQIWIDTRKRYYLSHAQVQVARKLGMNPKSYRKLEVHREADQPVYFGMTRSPAHPCILLIQHSPRRDMRRTAGAPDVRHKGKKVV